MKIIHLRNRTIYSEKGREVNVYHDGHSIFINKKTGWQVQRPKTTEYQILSFLTGRGI